MSTFDGFFVTNTELLTTALVEASEIFDTVRRMVNNKEIYTQRFLQRYINGNVQSLVSSALDVLQQRHNFDIQRMAYSPQYLANRSLTSPPNTISIEFSTGPAYNDNTELLSWSVTERRVITIRIDTPMLASNAQTLSTIHVRAGQDINQLMKNITSDMVLHLTHVLLDTNRPHNAAISRCEDVGQALDLYLYRNGVGSNHSQIDAHAFQHFVILSYLQAKHFRLDFLSDPNGIVQAKDFYDTWSPIAQYFYRIVHERDPPIDDMDEMRRQIAETNARQAASGRPQPQPIIWGQENQDLYDRAERGDVAAWHQLTANWDRSDRSPSTLLHLGLPPVNRRAPMPLAIQRLLNGQATTVFGQDSSQGYHFTYSYSQTTTFQFRANW